MPIGNQGFALVVWGGLGCTARQVSHIVSAESQLWIGVETI